MTTIPRDLAPLLRRALDAPPAWRSDVLLLLADAADEAEAVEPGGGWKALADTSRALAPVLAHGVPPLDMPNQGPTMGERFNLMMHTPTSEPDKWPGMATASPTTAAEHVLLDSLVTVPQPMGSIKDLARDLSCLAIYPGWCPMGETKAWLGVYAERIKAAFEDATAEANRHG